jgi:hypothetical protein
MILVGYPLISGWLDYYYLPVMMALLVTVYKLYAVEVSSYASENLTVKSRLSYR